MSVHEDTATLTFCIEDHEVKLLRNLYLQTQERKLYDITLLAHNVAVHAHRAVLCAQSAYFEALLSGRWSSSSTHDLSDLLWSAEMLRTLVDFMYTGKVEITKDNIEELLNTGTHLLMEDVRSACSKYLLANLAPKNCISIWQMAEQYQLQEVEAMCRAIAASRFQDYLIKRDDMLDLDQAFIEKIIQCGLFVAVPKEEVLQFVNAWQQHDEQNRMLSSDILELLSASSSSSEDVPMYALPESDEGTGDAEPSIPMAERKADIPMELQCVGEVTEAIFGYVLTGEKSQEVQKIPGDFDVYMYIKDENSWKFLDHFDQASWTFLLEAEHVGFLGYEAVYDGGITQRSALVDFQQKTFKTISFPNNSAATRRMFCFDSHVFLLEDHKCTGDNCTINHMLHILERSSMTWQKLQAFDIAELFPCFHASVLLSYTVISQKDHVFIWAQDVTSQCNGPFWLSLQRDPTKRYTITALEGQPLSKEDLRLPTPLSIRGWKHASFKLTADDKKIHAYRKQSICDTSLNFDLLLTYDRETNSWTRRENIRIALPHNDNLPIQSSLHIGSNSRSYIQVDKSCRMQSLQHGSAYIIEKVCPFVVRMWACHIDSRNWQALTPPPIEGIEAFTRFNVVAIPQQLASLLGTTPTYKGISDDATHSPMLHWDLCLTDKLSDIKLQTTIAQRIHHRNCVNY